MNQIKAAAEFLSKKWQFPPKAGLVLGTGLSGLADCIEHAIRIPYAEIPHFPTATVQSHKGELIFGLLNNVPVVALAGRFHYYEGYSMQEVTFPIRVLKLLGIDLLILSNAAGGVHPNFSTGDIALINDHINMHPENPLRGENWDAFGPRFPDMVTPYDEHLQELAFRAAEHLNIELKPAVYVGVQGPNLETKAEFNFFKLIGGHVVGMSTVPEVIVANHMKLPVLAFSIVTNEGWAEDRAEANVDDIIAVAQKAAVPLEKIVQLVLQLKFQSSNI
jgi:purine-nucleoside phosphorylase